MSAVCIGSESPAPVASARGPLVHRDIKSLNFLLDKFGEEKLGDFGLAKVRVASSTQSTFAGAVGTLRWSAPEFLRAGGKKSATPASDVYALGVVLWEILTLQIPYDGDDDETIRESIKGGRDDKLAIPPERDPKIRSLLHACWSNDPMKRPTAMEIMHAIKKLIAEEETRGNGAPSLPSPSSPSPHSPTPVTSAVLAPPVAATSVAASSSPPSSPGLLPSSSVSSSSSASAAAAPSDSQLPAVVPPSAAELKQFRSSVAVGDVADFRINSVWRVDRVSRIKRNLLSTNEVWLEHSVEGRTETAKATVDQLWPKHRQVGSFVRSLGRETGSLQTPWAVCVSAGRIFVSDYQTERVAVLQASDGSFLFQLDGQTQIATPSGVAVAGGLVYVVDQRKHRVCVFHETDGKFVREWGSFGSEQMQLSRPSGVAVADGLIYVSDSFNHRIAVFRLEADGTATHAFTWGSEGSGDGQFKFPRGVAVADGVVYICDAENHRVQAFRASDGKFLFKWGSEGSGDGLFNTSDSVAVCADLVYVSDSNNHSVCVFNAANGRFIRSCGSKGRDDGELDCPRGVAVADGLVYVADSLNHRVQVFRC